MTVKIDLSRCNGCHRAIEPPCVRGCPGDLLMLADGVLQLRCSGDCWDCAACVKACPNSALSLHLCPELGGRGSELTAHAGRNRTTWVLKRRDGHIDHFETAAVAAVKKGEES